jgi:glycine hydroxymethyltransferase
MVFIFMKEMDRVDNQISNLVNKELIRQKEVLNMIPSENYCSNAVLEACGSVLNNKYSEGYPKKRYYQGQEFVDEIELLAISRAKKLFGCEHVNLQPYSGSPANMAVYHALLKPGEKIMGMRLDMGGHLTHGHGVNFSAKYFNSVQYAVDPESELLDMNEIRKMALSEKPQVLVSGATAYPRKIDFKWFHEIAEEVGAYSLADISHIAGLVIGKVHDSPFPFTDVVMTTTHKTLRGPRGAMILCKNEDRLASVGGLDEKSAERERNLGMKIDRAVFPGLQGGPHMHIIAGKAVAFKEAMSSEFVEYSKQIVRNARALADSLMSNGIKLVTNGTDNHLVLLDLRPFGVGLGREGAVALERAGICANCNTVPYDPSTPFKPSGIRMGTPILTTRGMKENEMFIVGEWIAKVLKNMDDKKLHVEIRGKVKDLCGEFVVY